MGSFQPSADTKANSNITFRVKVLQKQLGVHRVLTDRTEGFETIATNNKNTMDLDFDRASSRLKKEQQARINKEKAKREADARAAAEAKRKLAEIEEQAKLKRMQQAEQEAAERERMEEEERRTGGVSWTETYVAYALEGPKDNGDRVTLPASALSGLEFKGAMENKGPMHFELTTREGGRTHCGVLEFSAEDGKIGLPSKVRSQRTRRGAVDAIFEVFPKERYMCVVCVCMRTR